MIDDWNAKILFRPICSHCKNIVKEQIECRKDMFDTFISPLKCDYCGRIFTSIEIPTSLPFNNEEDIYLHYVNKKEEFI